LIADYTAAWGTDGVGGVPGNLISGSDPQQLENFLRGNNMLFQEAQAANAATRAQQPNEFLTATFVVNWPTLLTTVAAPLLKC